MQRSLKRILMKGFICLVLVIGSASACASPFNLANPLAWGYNDFPPRLYTNDRGKPAGELAAVVKELMADLQIPYRSTRYPNRRFVKLLENHQLDFSFMVKSSFTQPEKVIFSEVAIGIVELRIYWLTGQSGEITQLNDLLGKTMIVIAGYSYGGLFEQGLFKNQTLTMVEDHQRAIEALHLKRGEYLLDYRKPFELATLNEDLTGLSYFSLQKIPVYMVLSGGIPNAKQLMQQLETSYKRLFPALYQAYNP